VRADEGASPVFDYGTHSFLSFSKVGSGLSLSHLKELG
jgi:hypothetical protein